MASISINSKNLNQLVVGSLEAKWSARGDRILRYYIDFRHKILNVHKEVSAPELFILQNKVDALMASWDEKVVQHNMRSLLQSGNEAADVATAEASAKLGALSTILDHTLTVDDAIDWDVLKDHTVYSAPKEFPEPKPSYRMLPEPEYSEPPKIGLFDLILGRKAAILEESEAQHASEFEAWKRREADRKAKHRQDLEEWEKRKNIFEAEYARAEADFYSDQQEKNRKVEALREALAQGDEIAVIEHASMVLDNSDYNDLFEKSYNLQYHGNDKTLLVAYDLPTTSDLPKIKSVRFVKSTGEFKETEISQRDQTSNFESVSYQVCLRTIHELFEADEYGNCQRILFNGYIADIDQATGQDRRVCILSVLVSRAQFEGIDLARVDPKSCFKNLQGVAAARLAALTPIAPVMEMDREDRRFIEDREIGTTMASGANVAAMPWEDFEHLVREVFEKEFIARGGEVRVTQSSRDEGVDAIAFDPDPITGGKVVIQAKRYTRTVGVSAVRDLYGTVMNEGASKGILVTTADYGADAHKFALGKPITLLNGGHLLHMLERHGYNATIDLIEARKLAEEASA